MVILQAISRIIRINQKKDVFIYLPMYMKKTDNLHGLFWEPDINIYKIIQEKNKTINQFLRDIGYEKGCREIPKEICNYLFSIDDSAGENHLFEILTSPEKLTMEEMENASRIIHNRTFRIFLRKKNT